MKSELDRLETEHAVCARFGLAPHGRVLLSVENVAKALRKAYREGMLDGGNVMLGVIHETREDLKRQRKEGER